VTAQPFTLDREERVCLLLALWDRQAFLRANLDRVKPSMAELGGDDLQWWSEHGVNVFDEISALVIKLGGDPTENLFGAMKVKRDEEEP
jgi:hypothetical protein